MSHTQIFEMNDDIVARTSIATIYLRLSGVNVDTFKAFGNTRLARCINLAHPIKQNVRDAHPSCSINLQDGGWNCFACKATGNKLELIMSALPDVPNHYAATNWLRSGTAEPLHAPPGRLSRRARSSQRLRDEILVATYPYVNADNELIYRVQRYEGYDEENAWSKRFVQSRPASRDRWIWHLGASCSQASCACHETSPARYHVPFLPFGLPEVREAIAKGRAVFAVEGEECVKSLEDLGFSATTWSGGTGNSIEAQQDAAARSKLGQSWIDLLTGAPLVVFLPDCDIVGREAMQAHRTLLAPYAQRALTVDLWPTRSDGYDVVDWKDDLEGAGADREQLAEFLREHVRTAAHTERAAATAADDG